MEESSFRRCKKLMIIFNILFLIGGLALLGIGIWVVVDFESFRMSLQAASLLFQYSAYLCIAIGASTVVLSLCGCIGAWKESKCLLVMFIVVLILFLLVEIAVLVLAFVFTSDLENLLSEGALLTLRNDYGSAGTFGSAATSAWDFTQTSFGCCGFYSLSDYVGSVYAAANPGTWPLTCCARNAVGGYVDAAGCLNSGSTVFLTGCYGSLRNIVFSYATVLGGVAAGVMVIQFLAVSFACCVSSNMGKMSKTGAWD